MKKRNLENKRRELIKRAKLIAYGISDYMDDFNKTRDTKDKKRDKK